MTRPKPRGSFADFLDSLRAFESGIDPDRHDWYVANLDVAVLQCPVTASPGRVVRDPETGRHRTAWTTVRDYFRGLGVLELFDPEDPSSLREMQYRSMNAWGYVGYQVGEEVLAENGYYEPARVGVELNGRTIFCPSLHIGGLPLDHWAGGNEERLIETGEGSFALATDVNRWRGRFLGRSGISSLGDLMTPAAQETVIREIIKNNLRTVERGLERAGRSLADCLQLRWPAAPGSTNQGPEILCTLSGIVASCHLCGSGATLGLLLASQVPRDELGTSALDYMDRFGGYEIEGGERV